MQDAQKIKGRVEMVRTRNTPRDRDYLKLIAIRRGDYDAVAPGLFNTAEFDRPLVANLVDTTARDIAEVMAPLPAVTCSPASLSKQTEQDRADLRAAIANGYVQNSRLQDQMFGGCDRYVSFGFLAFIVEPDYKDQMPVIRVDDSPFAHYSMDYRGRVKEYFTVSKVPLDMLCQQFPNQGLYERYYNQYGVVDPSMMVEVVRWYDDDHQCLVLLDDPCVILACVPNEIGRCPVRIIERPKVTGADAPKGQFDDVIWVQVARAMIQMYTMNALSKAVDAPIQVPKDADFVEFGPDAVIQADGTVGRVRLDIPAGLFPEGQWLAQEQRVGSRYPEGRSGSIDASIITGQGVQALMGTFDTQVQTFQRLCSSALEDVIAMCFEMDERCWGNIKKSRYIRDNGEPRKYDYTPSKDIGGNHLVNVTYGAIAGLDPNRGLVFVLQALAGGLISKQTAQKSLPVDMNPLAETRQIQMEQLDEAVAATLAMIPQAIPQMAMSGADPRDIALQVAQVSKLISQGKSPVEAMQEVFAPKEAPQPEASPLDMAQGAGEGPAGLPGLGSGGAGDLLMSLAGLTPGGNANLQSNVSRMRPVA